MQAEAWAWARVAMADEIVQAGFDETQIDRKLPLLNSFCLFTPPPPPPRTVAAQFLDPYQGEGKVGRPSNGKYHITT